MLIASSVYRYLERRQHRGRSCQECFNKIGPILQFLALGIGVLFSIINQFLFELDWKLTEESFSGCNPLSMARQKQKVHFIFNFVTLYFLPLISIFWATITCPPTPDSSGGDTEQGRPSHLVRTVKILTRIGPFTFVFCWTLFYVPGIWVYFTQPEGNHDDPLLQWVALLPRCNGLINVSFIIGYNIYKWQPVGSRTESTN